MALTFTAISGTTQTIGAKQPAPKTPIKMEANEAATFTVASGVLPAGLALEPGPGTVTLITGVATTVKAVETIKIKAENIAKSESKEVECKLTIAEAEFQHTGGTESEVEGPDTITGEMFQKLIKSGTPYKTASQAEVTFLNAIPAIERLN